MKYEDVGFRPFYHQFCILPITTNTKTVLRGWPGANQANGILTYGYYDSEAGLTLEVIAAAIIDGQSVYFEETSNDIRFFIRIGSIAKEECLFLEDEEDGLEKRYAEKLEVLRYYDSNEEVERTRKMAFLDDCRDEFYIDDVLVYLMKDGCQLEGCWTRIIGLGDDFFVGILLNEPYQDFGFHHGEKITFHILKTKENKYICYSNLNSRRSVTE